MGAKLPVEFKVDGQEYHFDMVVSGIYDYLQRRSWIRHLGQMHLSLNTLRIFNTFPEDRNGGGAYTADAIMKDTRNGKGTSRRIGSQHWWQS